MVPGLRERKKAALRIALSEAAMRLFTQRGFDNVTVREIAEAANVSPTTLLNHFPTKEALVFDRDDEFEQALITAITKRPPRTSAIDALKGHMKRRMSRVEVRRRREFVKLIKDTPALSAYWQQMWMRHELVLARILAKDLGRSEGDMRCRAMARFVLGAASLAEGSHQPVKMIETSFEILEHGWR